MPNPRFPSTPKRPSTTPTPAGSRTTNLESTPSLSVVSWRAVRAFPAGTVWLDTFGRRGPRGVFAGGLESGCTDRNPRRRLAVVLEPWDAGAGHFEHPSYGGQGRYRSHRVEYSFGSTSRRGDLLSAPEKAAACVMVVKRPRSVKGEMPGKNAMGRARRRVRR